MIGRRALLAAAAVAVRPARAQVAWYATGTRERAVRFAGAGGAMLSGTLLLPVISELQRVPGVVLIAGSGPTDRNGNNPLIPARLDTLRLIAERLAAARIASLRYDKRGVGVSDTAPAGVTERERFFAWEHFVADVQAAHAELLKHDEITPYATALLGHSEGGLLALAATAAIQQRRPHAFVLAATPGLPLQEIFRRQLSRIAPAFVPVAEHVMAEIRATGHAPSDVPPELRAWFPAYIGGFLRGALAFDPAKALAAIDRACLMVHGGADTQVVPLDDIQPLLDVLATRAGAGEALIAPMVSHNLKPVSGPADPGYVGPLAPLVANRLAGWLGHVLAA
jgi:pimeloyl-ACP methyl ester carboxylesterase